LFEVFGVKNGKGILDFFQAAAGTRVAICGPFGIRGLDTAIFMTTNLAKPLGASLEL
jgi:hypothetical protein